MPNILQSLIGRSEPEMIVLSLNGKQNAPAEEAAEAAEALEFSTGPEKPMAPEPGERLIVIPPRPSDPRPHIRSVPLSQISALLSSNAELTYASEQYRILRTRIVQLVKKPFQLVITSPSIGDGKTVTAVNLAVAMALRSDERTLLIDADLRRAGVHRMLQVPQEPGLADVLQATCRLEDAIFEVEELPGLHVLPAGNARGNPTELLDSARWRELAEGLRQRFAQTIIDCPPVELVADYDLIAAVCNGAVLVVRPDHTDRTLALAAIEQLKAKLTGVVVNATSEWFLWKRPLHHGYYYYRPADHTSKPKGARSK